MSLFLVLVAILAAMLFVRIFSRKVMLKMFFARFLVGRLILFLLQQSPISSLILKFFRHTLSRQVSGQYSWINIIVALQTVLKE